VRSALHDDDGDDDDDGVVVVNNIVNTTMGRNPRQPGDAIAAGLS
jgi:hypothetical protein